MATSAPIHSPGSGKTRGSDAPAVAVTQADRDEAMPAMQALQPALTVAGAAEVAAAAVLAAAIAECVLSHLMVQG